MASQLGLGLAMDGLLGYVGRYRWAPGQPLFFSIQRSSGFDETPGGQRKRETPGQCIGR